MTRFHNPAVAQAFEAYPLSIRPELLAPRELIFRTAASTPGVDTLAFCVAAALTCHRQGKGGSPSVK